MHVWRYKESIITLEIDDPYQANLLDDDKEPNTIGLLINNCILNISIFKIHLITALGMPSEQKTGLSEKNSQVDRPPSSPLKTPMSQKC